MANSFLHWFDQAFHGKDGPAQFAKARLIRYADDFVIMARFMGRRITDWVEYVIEERLDLTINREKTSVVRLREQGESLDFLGYTFCYDRDLHGRDRRYLNRVPSKKSLLKARSRIRELTDKSRGFLPAGIVVRQLNDFLRGWSNYFRYGYPQKARRDLDRYVQERLIGFLKRRSQRPSKPPEGMSWYAYIYQRLGVIQLSRKR